MARVFTDPNEQSSSTLVHGWTAASWFAYQVGRLRKWGSYGGLRSSATGSSSAQCKWTSPSSGTEYAHVFLKAGIFANSNASVSGQFRLFDDTAVPGTASSQTGQACAVGVLLGGTIKAYRGTTEIADSGVSLNLNQWYLLEAEIYLHDINGVFKVWLDKELIIDFSGDTLEGTTKITRVAMWGQNNFWVDDGPNMNNITMRYDGGGGTFAPSPGDTITDGTTGATAIVTAVNGDTTSGVLVLEGWDGVAFGDGNTITEDGGSTTATVDAPNAAFANGFEPNSGRMFNGFNVRVQPNANGDNSGLTGSDGNSVNNYQLVDEISSTLTPTDYVEATAVDQKDTYGGDFDGRIPIGATIQSLGVSLLAQSELAGIDGIRPVIRKSGVDYDHDRIALATGYVYYVQHLPVDTAIATSSDQSWTRATLVDADFEFGQKFVS
jgi:hypothetical protein